MSSRRAAPRGVLVTTAPPRPAFSDDEDEEKLAAAAEDAERNASRDEWAEIQREIEQERKRRRLAEKVLVGERDVASYAEVADEVHDATQEVRPASDSDSDSGSEEDDEDHAVSGGGAASSSAAAAPAPGRIRRDEGSEEDLPPEAAITAGLERREGKRGGKRKTGAKKKAEKRQKLEEEKEERRQADDPDRFVKYRLEGEKKEKVLDSRRLVHYHDFDAGVQGLDDDRVPAPVSLPPAVRQAEAAGNFRAALLRDLYDEED